MFCKPRPSPKLRTLTGCFMCRRRRKKCDERKPLCSGCERQDFKCVWPAPEKATENDTSAGESTPQNVTQIESKNITSSSLSNDFTKITLASSAFYGLPGITTSMDHYLSLYLIERFLPLVLRPNAHPGFHDWRPLITIGTEATTTMHAYLATAAMHASWTNRKLKVTAMRYYNSVVKSLGKAIADGAVEGSEDWVLHATNFLCLFEINQGWNTGYNPSGAAPHLQGLAQILKIRIAKDATRPAGLVQPQNRISAESLVLWTSALCLYYSDVDRVLKVIDWKSLSLYLEPEVFPGASIQANSPLLASNWKMHRIIFEIVRLSHSLPLDSSSSTYGRGLELDLKGQESKIRRDIQSISNPEDCFGDVLQQTLLYILVSRILIFKTLRPETRTCDTEIRSLIAEAMVVIKGLEIEPRCGPFLCWPLVILSCAIETKDDASLLRDKLELVWFVSYCGEVQRVRKAVEVFWERMNNFNLLDVLVYREGLFKHPYLNAGWGKPL